MKELRKMYYGSIKEQMKKRVKLTVVALLTLVGFVGSLFLLNQVDKRMDIDA